MPASPSDPQTKQKKKGMFVDQPTSNPPQNIPTGFRWGERHGEAHGCIGEGGRPIPNGHEDVIKR